MASRPAAVAVNACSNPAPWPGTVPSGAITAPVPVASPAKISRTSITPAALIAQPSAATPRRGSRSPSTSVMPATTKHSAVSGGIVALAMPQPVSASRLATTSNRVTSTRTIRVQPTAGATHTASPRCLDVLPRAVTILSFHRHRSKHAVFESRATIQFVDATCGARWQERVRDPAIYANRQLIVDCATEQRMPRHVPACTPYREFVEVGGLMLWSEQFCRATGQVDKTLNCARPEVVGRGLSLPIPSHPSLKAAHALSDVVCCCFPTLDDRQLVPQLRAWPMTGRLSGAGQVRP